MKFLSTVLIAALIMVTAVSATTTTLTPAHHDMAKIDTKVSEFCIFDAGGQTDIDVVISDVCKDVDGLIGCQAGDDFGQTVFTVTPVDLTIDDGE